MSTKTQLSGSWQSKKQSPTFSQIIVQPNGQSVSSHISVSRQCIVQPPPGQVIVQSLPSQKLEQSKVHAV